MKSIETQCAPALRICYQMGERSMAVAELPVIKSDFRAVPIRRKPPKAFAYSTLGDGKLRPAKNYLLERCLAVRKHRGLIVDRLTLAFSPLAIKCAIELFRPATIRFPFFTGHEE